ncbi:MAG: PaaI family thioesterase [Minwuia sp.]|uniref:PaaI family thioesterase n=1 Tax=Minwuia sp. TaxID=2493630 RepID=UPI003A897FF5
MNEIPEGFEPLARRSGLTDPWRPIFQKTTDRAMILGLRATEAHCNARGFVHGGLIAALADNAMGYSCRLLLPEGTRLVTISLTLDYMASGETGQWLTFETEYVKPGRSIAFAQCFVRADGVDIARANATFRASRPVEEAG